MTSKLTRGLSKYYLLSGRCWSITWHFSVLYSPLPPLCPQCGIVIGLMLIRVPGSLWTSQLSDRSWAVCWEPRDVKESMPLITERCALLVCIYVFKLPSAVHITNDRRRNKGMSQSFASNHNYYIPSLTCKICSSPLLSFHFFSMIHHIFVCFSLHILCCASITLCHNSISIYRAVREHVTGYTSHSSCN